MDIKRHVLDIRELYITFDTSNNTSKTKIMAVNGISYYVKHGEVVGVIGESGCGKTVSAMSIMGLLSDNCLCNIRGEIIFEGEYVLKISKNRLRDIRGNSISMVFQDPMTSLNPVFTVGEQIIEQIIRHKKISRKDAKDRALDILRHVNIPMPEKRIKEYPHQLSGGMRQRIMIGMAISCEPRLIIADEPTTALDVTIQSQILDLLATIRDEINTSIIIITHNFGIVSELAQYLIVMYCGKIAERGRVYDIFNNPMHPYTKGLLQAIPSFHTTERLKDIPGMLPNPADLPKGCAFHLRCGFVMDMCKDIYPEETKIDSGHYVNCWLYNI